MADKLFDLVMVKPALPALKVKALPKLPGKASAKLPAHVRAAGHPGRNLGKHLSKPRGCK